jgi:hypothetical protein
MTVEAFQSKVARRAMQACYEAIYPNDEDPTAASLRFIDEVIAIAQDETLPISRRIERLENRLSQYLRTNSVAAPQRVRPELKLVLTEE